LNIRFDDLDIDLGDGYFITAYEVDPDVRLEDSSFTATGLGGGDVVVPRADPVLYGVEVTAMHWGDADGNELHCWPEEADRPPVSYFLACYIHAEQKENEERILDHWTCENA
jgi:hypothetical protein